MTTDKFEFDTGVSCSPQWVSHKDYEGEGRPCSDKGKILINPPPQDGNCMICKRHVSELEAFGGPGDPCLGDFSGAKLIKMFREYYPGYTTSSWECRDCVARPGPLWAIDEEDRLGRPLTEPEYIDMQHEMELWCLGPPEETNQSDSKD